MTKTIVLPPSALALLSESNSQPKHNYQIYSQFMRRLESLPLESAQYQAAQRKLIDILEV